MGLYNARAWPALAADAASGAYDCLLHVGDVAYDLAALGGRRGGAFLRHIEPVTAQLPYMVVPGNHEWHANFSHYRCAPPRCSAAAVLWQLGHPAAAAGVGMAAGAQRRSANPLR